VRGEKGKTKSKKVIHSFFHRKNLHYGDPYAIVSMPQGEVPEVGEKGLTSVKLFSMLKELMCIRSS